MTLRKLTYAGLLLACCHCGSIDETPPYHFVLAPYLVQGGQRPTTPQNLTVSYAATTEDLLLQWDPAVDPDLGIPVGLYRIYLGLDGPPTRFFRSGDLFDETELNFYALDSEPFTGTLFFAVTAYDGAAESLPSESVSFSFL